MHPSDPTDNPAAGASQWMLAMVAICAAFLVPTLWIAAHWPLVHDEPIVHYIVFLMSRGLAPYRDIADMQMPGSYITDWLMIHILGPGAGGCFLWDLLTAISLAVAATWIAGQGRRMAGVVAAMLVYLLHFGSAGAMSLAQRDWTVAALLLLSTACLVQVARSRRNAWIAAAFLFAGCAATIKPPALLIPGIVLLTLWYTTGRSVKLLARFALYACLGVLAPFLVVFLFLVHYHALSAFWSDLHGLLPYYAGLRRVSFSTLCWTARIELAFLLASFALFLWNRSWSLLEHNLLAIASLSAFVYYVLQGKGFWYHLYPLLALALLWLLLEVERNLRERKPMLFLRQAAALAGVCVVAEVAFFLLHRSIYPLRTLTHLQGDLEAMGGQALSGRVQCLDMTAGSCVNVLYRMRVIQATGTISDFYLFASQPTPFTTSMQQQFLQRVTVSPPRLFILSTHQWPDTVQGYGQLSNFPQFQEFLHARYTITEEFEGIDGVAGYRLYVLNGTG